MSNEFKDFYVYVLMDEKEKEIFYVGKGKNGETNTNTPKKTPVDVAKQDRIEEIKNDPNNMLIPLTIGRYDTLEEATAVESTLIQWVYGFDNLTNGRLTGNYECIRNKNDFRVLMGIDVPED